MGTSGCDPRWGGEHLGERLRASKRGLTMTRDQYAYPNRRNHDSLPRDMYSTEEWDGHAWAYRDDDHTEYSDAFLLVQRDRALVNFDLSMRYFDSLDPGEFEAALDRVLTAGRTLKPVASLPDWDGVEGCYVMVFDRYKQFYVGTTEDIRRRIKTHWTARKPFDRILFGTPYDSIFPADELRPLDTTRLYAARSRNRFNMEERVEKAADQRFCLNRMIGGEATPLLLALTALGPRTRPLGLGVTPMKWGGEYQQARGETLDAVTFAATLPPAKAADLLAGMDMGIYSVTRDDGAPFMWSRRDGVASAVICGNLDTVRYAAFLEALGERVLWPAADTPRNKPAKKRAYRDGMTTSIPEPWPAPDDPPRAPQTSNDAAAELDKIADRRAELLARLAKPAPGGHI